MTANVQRRQCYKCKCPEMQMSFSVDNEQSLAVQDTPQDRLMMPSTVYSIHAQNNCDIMWHKTALSQCKLAVVLVRRMQIITTTVHCTRDAEMHMGTNIGANCRTRLEGDVAQLQQQLAAAENASAKEASARKESAREAAAAQAELADRQQKLATVQHDLEAWPKDW